MKTSKAAVVVSAILGKISSICGLVVGIPILVALISSVVDQEWLSREATISGVILLALSALAIAKGIQIRRRIKRFKQYVRLLSTHQLASIEELADEAKRPFAFVRQDLQKMIKRKYFANAVIDADTNQITISGNVAPTPILPFAQMKVVDCKNCGANSKVIVGQIINCEYCGSYLQ